MKLDSTEHYDMIELDCEDLKIGLSGAAEGLGQMLLSKLADDLRDQNEK